MESDRRNEMGETIGTGMGMWIINRTVADYNGSIDLSDNSKYTWILCHYKINKEIEVED
ncbi:hypothetical protein ACDK44_08400 [Haemophilus influenzae]